MLIYAQFLWAKPLHLIIYIILLPFFIFSNQNPDNSLSLRFQWIDRVAEAEREDRGSPELVQSYRGRGGGPEKEGGQHGGGPEEPERRVAECNGRYVVVTACNVP